MTWTINNRSQYILVAQKPQWVTLCLSPASDVNGPWKSNIRNNEKVMLHLAITYRKRIYIIEFGTLDNCKIILTQHICSAECIHTFCVLLTSDLSCKKLWQTWYTIWGYTISQYLNNNFQFWNGRQQQNSQ